MSSGSSGGGGWTDKNRRSWLTTNNSNNNNNNNSNNNNNNHHNHHNHHNQATKQPSNQATKQPSNQATKQPSNQATKQPSNQATKQPSNQPKWEKDDQWGAMNTIYISCIVNYTKHKMNVTSDGGLDNFFCLVFWKTVAIRMQLCFLTHDLAARWEKMFATRHLRPKLWHEIAEEGSDMVRSLSILSFKSVNPENERSQLCPKMVPAVGRELVPHMAPMFRTVWKNHRTPKKRNLFCNLKMFNKKFRTHIHLVIRFFFGQLTL